MALSNIRTEPRREITEQTIGVAIVVALGVADYYAANSLATTKGDLIFGMIMLPLLFIIGVGLLLLLSVFAHGIGEFICGVMAKFGADPRPTERYRRR